MGCRLSSIYGEERPTISKEQSKILSSTWHGIHSDLEKIGLLMFMGMFDNHPETKQFFGLSGGPMMSEDPKVVQKIQEHGLRFMSIARKLVANLDDPEKFDAILLDLGKRHHTYQADINLVDILPYYLSPTPKDVDWCALMIERIESRNINYSYGFHNGSPDVKKHGVDRRKLMYGDIYIIFKSEHRARSSSSDKAESEEVIFFST
ncbi:cytoglobin-1-like isoform X1 [Ptychodera flava]|uniref:cytoglobin-1-like isoform X1 n=1 Tax=Ptychodera flava TaxID=63121 RepID=UPI00396A9821